MAIFTALVALAFPALAGTFLGGLIASGLAIATSYAVSTVMKALGGQPEQAKADSFGQQGTLAAGGDVPRAFGLGNHMTAGSLVYANYWGNFGETPNAYLTQVIAVSDLPKEQLLEVWVQGEKCTLMPAAIDPDLGTPLSQYLTDDTGHHLWIKFYDGTQTAADTFLTSKVSSADRPWGANRIGTGVAYVIATSLVEEKLFSGFPTFKFVLSGIPLYDPTKDSTNGGSGAHRWSTPSTWGGDGDLLPAVQAYNVLRGIKYGSAWLYGLQNVASAARLPAVNWNTQIAKCRQTITGAAGLEPTYRAGGQVNVNTQPANLIEALLTACNGRLSEIGGFYKIHLGAPDSPTFAWTDADLLSSEGQTFRPFFSLADSINGIQGTYPDPTQGWETATAPPLYRTDLEVRDGNRRLMAAPTFDFVPYPTQVQRLQKSGMEESQRARTHVLPLPPLYWVVEPGDYGTWNSTRNGYVNKVFRVDSVVDRANLDVSLAVTEVDPADYDWNHATDYTGVAIGPTVFPRPQPQGVIDWFVEGVVLNDSGGTGRRPAIRAAWDGSLPGVVGVQYEVRLTVDLSHVTRGRTDQLAAGAVIISQGLIPLTAYQVRGQYLPSSPRDMLWSDWLDVTTPDIPAGEIPEWITAQVTTVMDYLNDRLTEVEQRFATVLATDGSRNWLDHKETRSQMSSRTEAAFAEISHVEQVATDADTAMASDITTLEATVGTNTANITTNATAIASIEGWGAAQYSVTLDVNNYATGFELINGGPGTSSTTFVTDKFLIASPAVFGGSPVPIFAVGNVDGVPKIGIRGDVYVDGTIAGTKIIAATVNADRLIAGTITSDSGKIGALSLKSLSIGDYAVVVPVAETRGDAIGATAGLQVSSVSLAIDTTGLAGKPITVIANFVGQVSFSGTGGSCGVQLFINGVSIQFATTQNSNDWFLAAGAAYTFTATGGLQTIPVTVTWTGGSTGTPTLGGRTLWAMTGKR